MWSEHSTALFCKLAFDSPSKAITQQRKLLPNVWEAQKLWLPLSLNRLRARKCLTPNSSSYGNHSLFDLASMSAVIYFLCYAWWLVLTSLDFLMTSVLLSSFTLIFYILSPPIRKLPRTFNSSIFYYKTDNLYVNRKRWSERRWRSLKSCRKTTPTLILLFWESPTTLLAIVFHHSRRSSSGSGTCSACRPCSGDIPLVREASRDWRNMTNFNCFGVVNSFS